MRVLLTADTVGGVWTYALELAQALQPHGAEVILATLGAPLTPDQGRAVRSLSNVQVHESHYKLEWMEDPWEDVAASGAWLLDLAQRFQPDVVHLNSYAHAALPWSVPSLVVGHSCVLSWWEAVKGEPAPPQWDRYRQEVRNGLQAARLVVAPSHAMLSALERHYGPLPSRRVIYNGRDPDVFTPAEKEPFIMTAGRIWDEAKNVTALEQVASRLLWPVYVAGEARHPGGGSVECRAVTPLGRLDETSVAKWLGRASIYALPARYEPFGLSVLEAALSGCALVLGDIASLREIWGDAALYVSPDDPAALVQSVNRLIEAPRLCEELAAQARERALALNLGRMGEAYLAAYHEIGAPAPEGREETALCAS